MNLFIFIGTWLYPHTRIHKKAAHLHIDQNVWIHYLEKDTNINKNFLLIIHYTFGGVFMKLGRFRKRIL